MAGLKLVSQTGSFRLEDLEEVELTTGTVLGMYDPLIVTSSTPTLSIGPKVARAVGTEGTPGTISHVFYGVKKVEEGDTQGYYDGVAVEIGLALRIQPGMEFEMEDDDGSLALADNFAVCDMVVSDANSTSGLSNVKLDSSAAATGGSQQFLILRPSKRVGDAIGSTGSKWIVKLNETQFNKDSFAGI